MSTLTEFLQFHQASLGSAYTPLMTLYMLAMISPVWSLYLLVCSLLSLFPIFPLFKNPKFSPIHCKDLAEIIVGLIDKNIRSEIIECTGPQILYFNEILQILSKSINLGGASIKDFSSSNEKKGSFQQHFRAYAREGEKCSNIDCKEKITRIIISNRSSFYCLSCQK